MGKGYNYVKDLVVNFKLDFCCWVIPVRIGLTLTGYLNVFIAVISLLGTGDESFTPVLVQVQAIILGENATKPVPMIAYCIELSFSVLLLCGLYRKDTTLMRTYMKYCFGALIGSIMFYSMVVPVTGVIVTIAMVLSIIFQVYVIILVRSFLVELRHEQKKMQLPTLVMSTLIQEKERVEKENVEKENLEVVVEAQDEEVEAETKPEVQLETVDEHPKEETTFPTVHVKA